MANNYLEFSESIKDITPDEAKWVTGIPQREDFEDSEEYESDEAWTKAYAEALKAHGVDAGVSQNEYDLFDFPNFASVLQEGDWWISTRDAEWGSPSHVADVVQGFIRKFRPNFVFTLTWCEYCDKLRLSEFGGGFVVVSRDRQVFGSTWREAERLAEAIITGKYKEEH